MNILLLNLPEDGQTVDNFTPEYLLHDFMHYPPLGLLAISADVDRRHNVEVLDSVAKKKSIDECVTYILSNPPQVLGISVVTWRLFAAYDIAEKVKKRNPNIVIVLGGPHFNYYPRETMEWGFIDYILTQYAEATFPQLIEALDRPNLPAIKHIPNLWYKENGNIFHNETEDPPKNLDSVPYPRRDIINLDDYFTLADNVRMTTVYTSRGCPYTCTFCDVAEKLYHYRSPSSVVDEFEIIKGLGIDEIHIFDDTFNIRRHRVVDLCNEIIKRDLKISWSTRAAVHPADREMVSLMKKAGCKRVHCGVETLEPTVLKNIRKVQTIDQVRSFFSWCDEFEIDTLAYFMLGLPGETQEYRTNFTKYLRTLSPTYVYINVLQPLPNTQLYDKLLSEGVFETDHWADFAVKPVRNFDPPSYRDLDLNDELTTLANALHRKFYLSPKFIIEDIKRTGSIELFMRKCSAAFKLISTFWPVTPHSSAKT